MGAAEARPLHWANDMRFILVFAAVALLLAPAPAEASCNGSLGPFILNSTPSVNCELIVYQQEGSIAPTANVLRNGTWVDVTGSVVHVGQVELEQHFYDLDCHGEVIYGGTALVFYDIEAITLAGAGVGEEVFIGEYGPRSAPLVPSGNCTAFGDKPSPYCRGLQPPCTGDGGFNGDDDVEINHGCNATGGAAHLALLALPLALIAGRPRRRRG